MKPLSKLTGGKSADKLKWTEELEEVFCTLKKLMKQSITLAFADYTAEADPLRLFTDASGSGVEACLSQAQEGQLRPIAYASMTFSDAQTTYNTLERELAAIRWGVKTFRAFLFGVDFIVHTDHQPLVYLQNMQIVNSRLARTLQDLSDYTFVIQYTPGKDNTAADALSRMLPMEAPTMVSPDGHSLPPGLVLGKEVPGGGDSLVLSLYTVCANMKLSRALPQSVVDLRHEIVDELRHPKQYHLKVDKQVKRELNLMRYAGQLMCMEALVAFSTLYQCAVYVHYGAGIPVVYAAGESGDLPKAHLQCLAGVHFNPLYETSAYVPPEPVARPGSVGTAPHDEEIEELDDSEVVDVGLTLSADWSPPACALHPVRPISSIMLKCLDRSCCALLDTGAQVSCMSATLATDLELPIAQEPTYIIKGVGNSKSPVSGSVIADVEIAPGSHVTQRFAVVETDSMPFCLILGIDCMTEAGLELDFGRRVLKVGNHEATLRGTSGDSSMICVLSCEDSESTLNHRDILNREDATQEVSSFLNPREVERLQKYDGKLRSLRSCLLTDKSKWPKKLQTFRRYASLLCVKDDIVVYTGGERIACVVSFDLLVEIMLAIHYNTAHPGRQKLIETTKEYVWHPSLISVAADITRTCSSCQKVKISAQSAPPVHKIVTSEPFELMAADTMSLPLTASHSVCCLVVIDHHSKWLAAVPLKSKKASAVIAAMKQVVFPFLLKLPRKLLTDNGTEFTSHDFEEMLREIGIAHVLTTPYKPSSNGLVERSNRTLTDLMRSLGADCNHWEEDLYRAVRIYNDSYHSEIEMSPSQFLLANAHSTPGRPTLPLQQVELWKEGNPTFVPFRKGQKVLRKVVFKGRLVADKFAERFEGPYEIIAVTGKVTYLISCLQTGVERRVHHTQVKRFYDPPKYIEEHPYYRERILAGEGNFDTRQESYPQLGDPWRTDAWFSNSCESSEMTDGCCSSDHPLPGSYSSCSSSEVRFPLSDLIPLECRGTDFLSSLDTGLCLLVQRRKKIAESERRLAAEVYKEFGVDSDSHLDVFDRVPPPSRVLFSSCEQLNIPTGVWPVSPITFDVDFQNQAGDSNPLSVTEGDFHSVVKCSFEVVNSSINAIETVLNTTQFSNLPDISSDSLETSLSQLEGSARGLIQTQEPFTHPESDLSCSAREVAKNLEDLRSVVSERRKASRTAIRDRVRRVSDTDIPFRYHTRSKGPVEGPTAI